MSFLKIKEFFSKNSTQLLLVLIVFLGGYFTHTLFMKSYNRDMGELLNRVHNLSANVTVEQQRREFILKARDVITLTNKETNLVDAFSIAEDVYDMSVKYRVDPVFLLAVLARESNFCKTAVSSEGAMGLGQMMPTTAKMLFRMQGIEYNDKLVFDIKTNIECTALYLNIISSTYSDMKVQLVCYNLGERYGKLYTRDKGIVCAETKKYVEAVSLFYNKFSPILSGKKTV